MPVYSSGTKITQALWERLLQSIPAGYGIWKDGSTYRAECLLKGGTDYSGTDASTVIQAAIDACGYGGPSVVLRDYTTYTLETQLALKCDLVGLSRTANLSFNKVGYALKMYDGGTQRTYANFGNFKITLGALATGGIQFTNNIHYCDLDRVWIVGSGAASTQIGINLDGVTNGCYWNRIIRPIITDIGTGIKFTNGANQNMIDHPVIRYPVSYGIDCDSGTNIRVMSGRIEGNIVGADGVRVNDDFCEFHGLAFELIGAGCDAYNILAPAADTMIFGGYFNVTGAPVVNAGTGTRIFHKNFQAGGAATIANGNSSCVVTHGLLTTPTYITLGGQHSEVAKLYADTIGATQFTIHAADGAVTADRTVMWYAEYMP